MPSRSLRARPAPDPADRIARDLHSLAAGHLTRAQFDRLYSLSYGHQGLEVRDLGTRAVYLVRVQYLPPGHEEVGTADLLDALEPE